VELNLKQVMKLRNQLNLNLRVRIRENKIEEVVKRKVDRMMMKTLKKLKK
jgi:hypothetical protein